jgi:hypothetical protein
VISYSNASTEWVEALSKKIKYLYLSVTNHQAFDLTP